MSACQEKALNVFQQCVNLCSLSPGSRAVIASVPDNTALYTLGLRPGRMVQCRGCQLFGGPLLVKTGDRQVAVGRKLAEEIIVHPD